MIEEKGAANCKCKQEGVHVTSAFLTPSSARLRVRRPPSAKPEG